MHSDDAFQLLRHRMAEARSLGYTALLPFLNQKVISEPVRIHNGDVWIDISIHWADPSHRALLIKGTAFGSNCWRMDRLDDQILVHPGE